MIQNNNTAGAGAENSGADELSTPSSPMRRRIWLSCYHCDTVNPYVQYHNHNTISFRSLPCWCYNCLGFNPHWEFFVTHFENYGWNTDDNDESDLQISIDNQNSGHGRAEEEIDNNGGSNDEAGDSVDYHWTMDDQLRWEDWMNSQLSEYENNFERIEEEEEEEEEDEHNYDENDYYREEIIWHYLNNKDCKKCGNNKEKEEEEDDEEGEICVVCQKEFEEDDVFKRLDCGHDYHYECISQWLLIKNSCPLCMRTVIPSDFESYFNYYFNYD